MFRTHLIALVVIFSALSVHAQNTGVWTPMFSFNQPGQMADAEGKIYCKAENAIFSYDPSSGELGQYSKVDRLSDVGVTSIVYYAPLKTLIIGYSNGNIDLMSESKTINVPDLKHNKSLTSKRINCITIGGNRAYIGSDFGIAVLNIETAEFEDTYFIAPQAEQLKVSQISIDSADNRIFAATPSGLMVASLSGANLADFSEWKIFQAEDGSQINTPVQFTVANKGNVYASGSTNSQPAVTYLIRGNKMELFSKQPASPTSFSISQGLLHITEWNNVYIYDKDNYLRDSKETSVNIFYALTTNDGKLWLALEKQGITDMTSGISYAPNGPFHDRFSEIVFDKDDNLYAVFGIRKSLDNAGFGLYNGTWYNRTIWDARDACSIVLDKKKPGNFFIGTGTNGIYYYEGLYNEKEHYDDENSPLEYYYNNVCEILDVSLDKYNNLWVCNWYSTKGLKVMDPERNWHFFSFPHPHKEIVTREVFINSLNQKWVYDGMAIANPIYAFNENGTLDDTSDDKFTFVGIKGGEEDAFASFIFSIAEDKNGTIWIGTDNGIANFTDPSTVFSVESPQFRRIKVTNDSIVDYLLEGVEVRSIAVDAGNRKWFGTLNDGVFLMSDNGTEIIKHFTAENSPLPSNFVSKIAIRPSDGQVYFCTDKATVAYKSDAYEGVDKMEKITVVPNPIREDYRGNIYISGLVENALVKITDISGNLVYETYSNGGMATWPGVNLLGNRPQTGVYFIFISNADGSSTRVGKLIFIN